MERAVALKKLRTLLGKSFGYKIDTKAPTIEEREDAKAQLAAAVADRDKLRTAAENRRREILAADHELQDLWASAKVASERVSKLNSIVYTHKITVGTSSKLFFHVAAEGSSWEEVINKLTKKEKAHVVEVDRR